jgi:hypothetical protein
MTKIADLIEALQDEIAILQEEKHEAENPASEKLLTTLREFFDRFGPLLSNPPTVESHSHMTAWLRSIRDLVPEP